MRVWVKQPAILERRERAQVPRNRGNTPVRIDRLRTDIWTHLHLRIITPLFPPKLARFSCTLRKTDAGIMLGSVGDATAQAVRHTKSGLEDIRLPWSMRLPNAHLPCLGRVVIRGSQGLLLNRVVVVRGHREHLHRVRTIPGSIELVSMPSEVLVGGKQAIKLQQLSTNDVLWCKVRIGTFLGCKRVTYQRWYEQPPRLTRHEPQEAVITRDATN